MRIFAITTRGLEAICAQEMATVSRLAVRESAYRRVLADYSEPGPLASSGSLLALRTVDDIYLEIDTWDGILRQRDALVRIQQQSAGLKLEQDTARLSSLRSIAKHPTFSVTASFVGKRNYSSDEIKTAVARGVATHTGWQYTENDQPGALNLRLFIEGEQALVGLRLSDHPMHQRPYKQANIPGSTKPTVAAAMVRLAEIPLGAGVLDPCCGAGTILIEAALQGAPAVTGGDIDPQAISAAKANFQQARVRGAIQQWDAQRLPLPDGHAARIISNLPWGRQVSVKSGLDASYQAITSEMRRVLAPGGRIVLLANAPDAVSISGMRLTAQIEISLFGQNPKILIFD